MCSSGVRTGQVTGFAGKKPGYPWWTADKIFITWDDGESSGSSQGQDSDNESDSSQGSGASKRQGTLLRASCKAPSKGHKGQCSRASQRQGLAKAINDKAKEMVRRQKAWQNAKAAVALKAMAAEYNG